MPKADLFPAISVGNLKADLFLAKPDSPAEQLSRGFKAKGVGALIFWLSYINEAYSHRQQAKFA